MLKHCKDNDASALWQYFSCVLEWVRSKFTTYNKTMKVLDWGAVYEDYTKGAFDNNIIHKSADEINKDIINLMSDDEITAKMKGIVMYIIYGDERYLQLRQFEEKIARIVYEKQKHKCPFCVKYNFPNQ